MTYTHKSASDNRTEMPNAALLIDEIRLIFGDDIKVLRAIDYETNRRATAKGEAPFELPISPALTT